MQCLECTGAAALSRIMNMNMNISYIQQHQQQLQHQQHQLSHIDVPKLARAVYHQSRRNIM